MIPLEFLHSALGMLSNAKSILVFFFNFFFFLMFCKSVQLSLILVMRCVSAVVMGLSFGRQDNSLLSD